MGFAKGEALRLQDQIHHAQRLIKKQRFSNMLKRIENT